MCEVVKSSAGGKEFYYCRTHKKEAKIPSSCLEIETEVARNEPYTITWPDNIKWKNSKAGHFGCVCQYPLVGRPHANWCPQELGNRVDSGDKTYD